MSTDIDIPKRALFKPAEVCSIAGVQQYVLRSWEAEFPGLGRSKKKDGTRIYRRAEVELVLRIKHLLFVDGLTLGAARRQLQEEQPEAAPEASESLDDLFSKDARERLVDVRRGLQEILELLSQNGDAAPPRVRPKVVAKALRAPAKKTPAVRKRARTAKAKTPGKGKGRRAR